MARTRRGFFVAQNNTTEGVAPRDTLRSDVLVSSLRVALHTVGSATSAGLLVARHSAKPFFNTAFDLVAHAFDLAFGAGGVALGSAFRFQIRIAGELTDSSFDVPFQFIDAFTHAAERRKVRAISPARYTNRAGADAFIAKPFDLDAMEALVEHLLGASYQRQQGGR